MTEEVLQFIWQTQSFEKSELFTTEGYPLKILNQGVLNRDSGPDFSQGRVILDNIEWIGDIEIHIKSSDWHLHKHQNDVAYNKVVLHVVWEHDQDVKRLDGSDIPTFPLKDRISHDWFNKYEHLSTSIQKIPCEAFFNGIDSLYKVEALNKVLIERLERKAYQVLKNLELTRGDWEQVAIRQLFEYFGFKKNNEAFKHLASLIDIRILRKLTSIKQVEAYLIGMAGLLPKNGNSNPYYIELYNEFNWIRTKFRIQVDPMSATWWKFMRMRPANFPTIRLSQLSVLLFQRKNFFQSLLDITREDAETFFKVTQSEFWLTHYHFNKESARRLKGIGEQSARILGINVAAALLVAYGQFTGNNEYVDKAIGFLEKLKPEDNKIIRIWKDLSLYPVNAAESQGAIELFNNYCIQRRCLTCSIGRQVLKPE